MSPTKIIKSMSALFIGMAFLFAGNAVTVSSISVILKARGVSEIAVGLVSVCFYAGALTGTLVGHRFISKIGHVRAFGIFAAAFGICTILHSLNDNLIFWAALRFFVGLCYYGLLMLIESWLNEKSKNAVRSRVLAFYEIVFYSSFGLGILILGLDLDQHSIFVVSAALILFSSLPLNLIRIKQPQLPPRTKISIPKIFDIAPLAIVTAFISGVLINGFFSMSALFILLQGYDARAVSFFMFFAMMGGFVGQMIIGTVSDKIGRKFAIISCSLLGLVASIILALFHLSLFFQYALAFFLGGGIFCLYALALARANDMLKDRSRTVELGRGVLFCYTLGAIFAPLILGVLMQYFSYEGFALFFAALLGFLILFAINKPNIVSRKFNKRFFR